LDPIDASVLLLVEYGAKVPAWLESVQTTQLNQCAAESASVFVERSAKCLSAAPTIRTVVVALSAESNVDLEERIQVHGRRLVELLAGRARARLLFDAPSETSERQRRRLLGLTAELAQCEDSQQTCVVGAHFSAQPPSSSKIPIHRG
jgi:hypothetical protein